MIEVKSYVETQFKESEIGSIPADWGVVKLKDIVTFTRKPRDLDISKFDVIPFIPMEQIPDEGIYAEQYRLKSPEEISSGSYCEDGDLLLAKITPSFENGKQGIVRNLPLGFAYTTTEVYAFNPDVDKLDKHFLFCFLKLPSVRADIAGRMEGTTGRQRVPKAVLENYLLPLPPLPEQRCIAAVLNAIQDEIAVQDDIIASAKDFKRSLMQRLFTFGAGEKSAEVKETELGEIPAHWELRLFGDCVEIVSGQVDPRLLPYRDLVHVGSEHIEPKTGRILAKRTAAEQGIRSGNYLFTSEHVLYSKIRPYLVKVTLPHFTGVCSADIYPLFPKPEILTREFLFHYLVSDTFTKQAVAHQQRTGIPKINREQLNSTHIPVPPTLEEQSEIAIQLSSLDQKIAAEEDRKAAMQDFFKTMLHQLITGQIRLLSDGVPPL